MDAIEENLEILFPAHAGVILKFRLAAQYQLAFPRTRGGDPSILWLDLFFANFSPHTRG